jgi:hypothetical protein
MQFWLRGRPFALDTNGTVLLASRIYFDYINLIFFDCKLNIHKPLTFKANANFLVWFSISLIKNGFIDTGGKLHAESPE